MTVAITSVAAPGALSDERVVMKASSDDDMTNYAVFQTRTSTDGRFYGGKIENVYWFAGLKVKEGDLIVLYSKSGKRSEKKNDSGSTSYFFYWGHNDPLWVPGKTPVLVKTTNWQVAPAIK